MEQRNVALLAFTSIKLVKVYNQEVKFRVI